jgi:hypothetical protein
MDTTMELDDLKLAWKTLDARLQQQNALQLAELHDRKIGRIRASLRPLMLGQIVQMLFGAGCVIVGVGMWKTFSTIVPVLLAGIVFHVYGVLTIIAAGIVLGGIARIDHSLPVLELQQRLASLRKSYLISGMVIGLPWWVLWVLPLVAVASLHNAQVGAPGLPLWIWLCMAGGAIGILATWMLHRWLQRPGREALAERMQDSAAGGSLRRAQAELDALKRYAEE